MTLYFNVISKRGQKASNQGSTDYEKHTQGFNDSYYNKLENINSEE